MLDDDESDDLYTADDVEEMLAVAVLKATQRDREELAGLRAALRVAELADLPASVVRKALDPESHWTERANASSVVKAEVRKALDPDPQPDDDTDPDDTDVWDGDPAEDLFAAALAVAEQALQDGTDAAPALARLYALRDDPDALREALGAFAKAGKWDHSKHPRDKAGKFIGKDAIADAKSDPAKAAALRDKVKPEDAQKLDDALSGKTDLGTTAKRQKKDAAQGRRQVKEAAKADRKTARDLASKMMLEPGARTADNYHAIIPHLSTMTGAELKELRLKLGGKFGGKRTVSERAAALTEWARKQALDARMDEQGFSESEKNAGKEAVGAAEPEPVAEPQAEAEPPLTRGAHEWKQNKRGLWAWHEGDKQVTGAYPDYASAEDAYDSHGLSTQASAPVAAPSVRQHPEYERLDNVYGRLSESEIDAKLSQMSREIDQNQRAGAREFNQNGGRRTGAAVSSQAARDVGQEKLLLEAYKADKFAGQTDAGTGAAAPTGQAGPAIDPNTNTPEANSPKPADRVNKPAKPRTPKVPDVASLDDPAALTAAVHAAAERVRSISDSPAAPNRPGWEVHKAPIADVYDEMVRAAALPPGTTIEQFKTALLGAQRAGAVSLGRNDLSQFAPGGYDHARNQIDHPVNGTYHLINVPGGAVKPQPPAPATPAPKTRAEIAAEITARRQAREGAWKRGADDANPTAEEIEAASRGAQQPVTAAQAQPKAGSALTGWHKETFDKLAPAMASQLDKEVTPRRKAQVAYGLLHGEPPSVQKELVDHLKQIAPDAFEYARDSKQAPLAFRHLFT